MQETQFDILIVGAGPAAYTAAIYSQRANIKVGMLIGAEPGGQLMKTTTIENYPGFLDNDPMSAWKLIEIMQEQCKDILQIPEYAETLTINPILINKKYSTKALIIATGSTAKVLGLEDEHLGYGISTCATCDGPLYKNKTALIIGGGNTAVESAIYLENICKQVILVHRSKSLRADIILQTKLKKTQFFLENEVIKYNFNANKELQSILLKNNITLKVDAVFLCIGHTPNTSWCNNYIKTNYGYIENAPMTEIPGIFAAGEVADSRYKQAITSAGQGCAAAIEAIQYVNTIK